MNGLALSKQYFEEYGLPMLKEQFPEVLPNLACGLFGSGSECLGYDDELSRDHDFEPGFLILLPGEETVDRRTEFLLERAYAKLPKEFMGVKRSLLSPVGGNRHGVVRMDAFFEEKTGSPDGVLTADAWLCVPEQSLLEATGGELFLDVCGKCSRIREALSFYPEDIRLKKLAGYLLLMAQSGQYNYRRCLGHGETAAAQLAVFEFVKSAMSVIFLLNRRYQPYYKWAFRALRALPVLSIEAELMEFLLTTDNDGCMAEEKTAVIEGIAADVIDVLMDEGLTKAVCGDLEKHAYSVADGIADASLRNSHILAGVS
ncbi:MAG: DUF4037 domain-containing protein [Lachnospiraceae bacterium]|nr:DUF4037 domain-containing protein [Lachnospiraceae bacterium]